MQRIHYPLQWHHNGCDGISNNQLHDCLLNRLLRRRSKETSKLHVTGLCEGNSPVTAPHKWPVTRKMFPFDDVVMHRSATCWTGQLGRGRKCMKRSGYIAELLCRESTVWLATMPVLISNKTCYGKISKSMRLVVKIFVSLWNLIVVSAAMLPKCLSNFRVIKRLCTKISWIRDFAKYHCKTTVLTHCKEITPLGYQPG